MNTHFSIKTQSVHLWRVVLSDFIAEKNTLLSLLTADEVARAQRFRFDIHRTRFTIARGFLRKILSFYTQIPANEIQFSYAEHGKPRLQSNPHHLQFNVSHSHDIAIYAFTLIHEIGIDIEKIEDQFEDAVAKRFFSEQEYHDLHLLPEPERIAAFYRIWAHKEALIKALGKGLYVPLADFSISLQKEQQTIELTLEKEKTIWYLQHFTANPQYQSAFAINHPIDQIQYFEWNKANQATPLSHF